MCQCFGVMLQQRMQVMMPMMIHIVMTVHDGDDTDYADYGA